MTPGFNQKILLRIAKSVSQRPIALGQPLRRWTQPFEAAIGHPQTATRSYRDSRPFVATVGTVYTENYQS
jgi:hypothetical protein